MKTPREVLISKHQSAQPKLDLLRQQLVSRLPGAESEQAHPHSAFHQGRERSAWLQLLQTLRWHLAGLSAVWVLIALLRFNGTEVESTPIAQVSNEPPRTAIALLKENRRQIVELGDSPSSSVPPAAPASPKSRRSAIQVDWAYS